jgi:hypothetical protein
MSNKADAQRRSVLAWVVTLDQVRAMGNGGGTMGMQDFAGRVGFPNYALTNNSANIIMDNRVPYSLNVEGRS